MYSFLDIFTIVFLSQCLMRYLMIEQGVYHTLNCASSFAPPPPPFQYSRSIHAIYISLSL